MFNLKQLDSKYWTNFNFIQFQLKYTCQYVLLSSNLNQVVFCTSAFHTYLKRMRDPQEYCTKIYIWLCYNRLIYSFVAGVQSGRIGQKHEPICSKKKTDGVENYVRIQVRPIPNRLKCKPSDWATLTASGLWRRWPRLSGNCPRWEWSPSHDIMLAFHVST